MSKFLCIENPGVAPVEAFTLLGASNKAGTDAIGQFGSGAKHGPLVLLRNDIPPTIYSGLTKIEYGTVPAIFEGANHKQVVVRLSGKLGDKSINRTEKLSIVANYGSSDWKSPLLACREFVSNALDAVNGNAASISVSIVDAPRAKAGFTRVYVPLTDEIATFHTDIKKWFLHFTDTAWKQDAVIRKAVPSPARIYRRGVFVREVQGKNSLFDYNLNSIDLDESRVANDYTVRYYASIALERTLNPEIIAELLVADPCWEHSFDFDNAYATSSEQAKQAATWKEASQRALGDETVIATETQDAVLAERKGYKVKRVTEGVYKNALKHGLRTVNSILTTDERDGRRIDAETDLRAVTAVIAVWEKLLAKGYTRNEVPPKVFTFVSEIQSESKIQGFYRDGGVYINTDLLSSDGSISRELYATVLEEIAHHVTKALDNSRDFQEYFLQIAVSELIGK